MTETPKPLETRVAEILVERLFLDIAPDALEPDASLTDAYGVDSVRLFDMIVGLEEDFSVSFADEELTVKNFDTVAAIVARVRGKLDTKA